MNKSFRDNLKMFYVYAKPYKRQFALGLLALLVVDALGALPPLLLKGFVDEVGKIATLAPSERRFSPFLWIGLIYAAVAVGQGACRYLWRMLLSRSSHRAAEQLRKDYFAKLQRLPPSFYDRHPIGDLMALATNDVEAVRYALGPGLLVFADAVFLFLALPPAMLWLSPKLTLLALLPTLVLPFIVARAEKLVHERFEQVQEQFSKLSGFAQENIEGIQVIKAFVREWTQLGRFSALGKDFVRLNLKLTKAQAVFEPAFLLASSTGFCLLLVFGGRDVMVGAIGIGTFVAFTRYLDNMAWPMMAFGMAVTHYQRGKTSLGRIHEVLEAPEHPQQDLVGKPIMPIAGKIEPKQAAPMLEARGLTFTYPGQNQPALANVSFRLERGTKTAVTGPVGGGKTTLVRLLAGLYGVAPGMLFWEGVDVTEIPLSERREKLALVPQDAFLFSESLAWNIGLGIEDAAAGPADTDTHIRKSIERAGLAQEAAEWGLASMVGEKGLNLSGGQRSRVALARAFARALSNRSSDGRAPLLVLDDALSSVDAETESCILNGLGELGSEVPTLLMVTHRLTRLSIFEKILVFREGELVQCGSPEELAVAPGLCRSLLELQQIESGAS